MVTASIIKDVFHCVWPPRGWWAHWALVWSGNLQCAMWELLLSGPQNCGNTPCYVTASQLAFYHGRMCYGEKNFQNWSKIGAFKTRFKIYKLTLLINQDIFIIATENFKDSFKFSRPSLHVNNNDESALTHEKQWQQLDYKMFITLSSLSSTTCLAFDIIILSPIPSSSSSSSSSLHHLHHHHHHVYHHQHHYQDCY